MQIKLSDFILEESISTSTTDDIILAQELAQMDVCLSLCNAYMKEYTIEDYLGEYNDEEQTEVLVETFVTEAEGSEESDESSDEGKSETKTTKRERKAFTIMKAALKAIGHFMKAVATKLGIINSKPIKNGKRLVRLLEESDAAEIKHIVGLLKNSLGIKSDHDLYTSYNPDNADKMLQGLLNLVRTFSSEVERFCDDIESSFRKTDKKHLNAIYMMNDTLAFFAVELRKLDKDTSIDVGQYFSPKVTDDKFRDRLIDYVTFYDMHSTQQKIGEIQKLYIYTAKIVDKLDRRWNYTEDNRHVWGSKEHPFRITPILDIDRSQPKKRDKYMQIRNTIHTINDVIAGGGKRSIIGRIDLMTQRYMGIYSYYVNKIKKAMKLREEEDESE